MIIGRQSSTLQALLLFFFERGTKQPIVICLGISFEFRALVKSSTVFFFRHSFILSDSPLKQSGPRPLLKLIYFSVLDTSSFVKRLERAVYIIHGFSALRDLAACGFVLGG